VRSIVLCLFVTAAACSHQTKSLVDPELASALPTNAAIIAGLDIDRLRNTPLFAKLPESFRDASYVLAAYDAPNLVTASRTRNRIVVSGPAAKGAPPDLLRYAAATPLWIVVRGSAPLPLAGNLANINRLLEQTERTLITATVADRIQFEAEGVCATPAAADHLAGNARAIATLAKLPLDVQVDGNTVRVTGSAAIDAVARLF
jgi:hypothetical protein